jgi:serine/threonine-protein kinase RsbT
MDPVSARDRSSGDVLEQVLAVLCRYVTRTTAQSILTVARGRLRMASGQVTAAQLNELVEQIERATRLFVNDPVRSAECKRALAALASGAGAAAIPPPLSIAIKVENDIARARADARNLAGTMGFSSSGQTRLATIVSELARNIVQYAKEGQIDLKPGMTPRGVEIVAKDRGPGIPNLDEIMSGSYRSRLGMGLGILGVKRLADPFTIETEAGRGTTVRAFLKLA